MRVPNFKSRIKRLEKIDNVGGVQESDLVRLILDVESAVKVEFDGSKNPQDLQQAADLNTAWQNLHRSR